MAEPRISDAFPSSLHGIKEIQKEIAHERAVQIESQEDLNQYFELSAFNPMQQAQKFKNLKDLHTKHHKSANTEKTKESDDKILDVEQIEEIAEKYYKDNYELNSKTLRILRSQLSQSDSADTVLEKVEAIYQEAALADEALDFLYETTEAALQMATAEAKEKLNKDKGKEIRAGRNMGAQAREFSKEGLGSPSSLRDLYRDITNNPRPPIRLFDELAERFRYEELKSIIHFILHSLGSDLKAKGPSIEHAELKRLLDETRSMQGILGVFRFFQSRMRTIHQAFGTHELLVPAKVNFEILSRMFIKLLIERFLSPDKIIQTAKGLGISEEAAAQMVIYSQMRDAIRQIAPKYFRDRRHKEEVLKAFLDAIEKLEDKMEEEEE